MLQPARFGIRRLASGLSTKSWFRGIKEILQLSCRQGPEYSKSSYFTLSSLGNTSITENRLYIRWFGVYIFVVYFHCFVDVSFHFFGSNSPNPGNSRVLIGRVGCGERGRDRYEVGRAYYFLMQIGSSRGIHSRFVACACFRGFLHTNTY